MSVLITQAGLMYDTELTTLPEDPDWQPMQLVEIDGRKFAAISKSNDRRNLEYRVVPLFLLRLLCNQIGIDKFKEVNPGVSI